MDIKYDHGKKTEYELEKKFRLSDFFMANWAAYCMNPKKYIRPEQFKAVNSIMVCGTEVLGVEYYACPECGDMSTVFHSCKNRFCPRCSWKDTIQWSEKIKEQMLNIPHRHVVFTLPHQLNGLLEKNRREILNFMARNAAETFKDWMRNKYGLKIGIVSVIHTFGSQLNLHPHVHMIVSWGGIDLKTGELRVLEGKKEEYVKFHFLKTKFRCKFEDELIAAFDNDKLVHNFINRQAFMKFIKKINNKNWHIHLEPPMDCPAAVVRYIGRYSKRACLSEYKISNIEGEYITFKYKDYKQRDENNKAIEKEKTLHYNDFFPLLLQHVPQPYFRNVRYYGAYGRFKNIPDEYKAGKDTEVLSEIIEEEYQNSQNDPKYCFSCTSPKIFVYQILDIRIKAERTEPFDITRHKHIISYNPELLIEEKTVKNVA